MSYVTDLTLIFPNRHDAQQFEKVYHEHTGDDVIELPSGGSKGTHNRVYTFGLNYVLGRAPNLLDVLEKGPWANGTVLYVHHEADDEPTVKVFWASSE